MVEQVLIATGVVGLVFVVAAGVATTLAVRRVRRGFRRLRARVLEEYPGGLELRSVARTSGSVVAASIGSPGWWAVQTRRHRMWTSVTGAEHAVRVARRSGVAVGDLPLLASRLRVAATGVDAVLRAGSHQGGLKNQDRAECERIATAAAELRSAALSSLRSDARADVESVASAVKIEVAALAAGVRTAHG